MLAQPRSVMPAAVRQGRNGRAAKISAPAYPSCHFGAPGAAPCLQAHAGNCGHGEGHAAARGRWRSSTWAQQCTAPGRDATSVVRFTPSPQLLLSPPADRAEGSGDGAGSYMEPGRAGVNDAEPPNDAIPVDIRVQDAGEEQQQQQRSEAVGTASYTPGVGSVCTSHQLVVMPVTTQPSSNSRGSGGAGNDGKIYKTPADAAGAMPNPPGLSPQASSGTSSLVGAVSRNERLGAVARGRGGGWRSPTSTVATAAVGKTATGSSVTRAVDTSLSLGCLLLYQLRHGAGSALYWLAAAMSWPSLWVWRASALLLSQPTQPGAIAQGAAATAAGLAGAALLAPTAQQAAGAKGTCLATLSKFLCEVRASFACMRSLGLGY